MPKLLDDVNAALEKLRSIGGASAEGLPEQLTAEQKQQAADAIKDLSVEIYTGAEDKILRRMLVTMKIETPEGSAAGAQSADIKFDLQLLDLNEDQEIEAPENPKPFAELASQLDSLGLNLGGLGSGRWQLGRRRLRRRRAEPGEVLRVHPGSRGRQQQDSQVRGPAGRAVTPEAAYCTR